MFILSENKAKVKENHKILLWENEAGRRGRKENKKSAARKDPNGRLIAGC
jgi:hypothetical protein